MCGWNHVACQGRTGETKAGSTENIANLYELCCPHYKHSGSHWTQRSIFICKEQMCLNDHGSKGLMSFLDGLRLGYLNTWEKWSCSHQRSMRSLSICPCNVLFPVQCNQSVQSGLIQLSVDTFSGQPWPLSTRCEAINLCCLFNRLQNGSH